MRRLLTFSCEGATLAGSLEDAGGKTGLLLITGGSQTRIGSHRMYERLCKSLARKGFPSFRFDRRGVGDSEGDDHGFRESGADLRAAAAAFRQECPRLQRIVGFGLCDGATTLALFGRSADLDGLILVNPWLVEADSDARPPAAIKQHYRKRLLSLSGWKRLLSGAVDYQKLFRGILKISKGAAPSTLAEAAAQELRAVALPLQLILARGDATAIAAEAELEAPAFAGLSAGRIHLDTDSHTFARLGDEAALLGAVEQTLKALAPAV